MAEHAKKTDAQNAWPTVAIVIVLSIVFGFVILPRLSGKAAHNGPLVGMAAPDFILPLIPRTTPMKSLRRSDLEGRVVVLEFWASWCGPCKQQAPIVDRVARKLAGPKVAIYGVNTSDTERAAEQYLTAHPASYPSLLDEEGEASRLYAVTALPTLVVIDREGKVRAMMTRVVGERELEALIEDAGKS